MNKFSLVLKNPSLEKDYNLSKIQTQWWSFFYIAVICFTYITWNFIIEAKKETLETNDIAILVTLVVLCPVGLFFLRYKLPKLTSSVFLVFTVLFTSWIIFEVHENNERAENEDGDEDDVDETQMSNGYFFFMGALVEALSNNFFSSKTSFLHNLVNIITFNCVLIYRNFNHSDVQITSYKIVFLFLAKIMLTLVYQYTMVRSDKQYFLQVENKQSLLKEFEKLLNFDIPTPVLILGLRKENLGNVIFENKAAEELFGNRELGLMEGELSEDPLMSCNKDEKIGVFKKILKKLNEEVKELNAFQTMQVTVTTKEQRFFEVLYGRIKWNKETEALLIINDVSDNRKIGELQSLHKKKDLMLATVSHDLRTPLNGLLGHVELAYEGSKADAQVRKPLSIALKSGQILEHMINDILDFSQISNNTIKLNYRVFKIAALLEKAARLIKFQAKLKGLDFTLDNTLDPNSSIYSDPVRLQQILINLLGNSVKFTKQGWIKLKAYKSRNNVKEEIIVFSVEDSGTGIRSEDLGKLFRVFGKLEMSDYDSVNHTGVGLGLAISQNLAQLILPPEEGGGIKVRSEFGVGSEFYFAVQLLPDEQRTEEIEEHLSKNYTDTRAFESNFFDNSGKNSENQSLRKLPTSRLVALIVDDDPLSVMVAQRFCEHIPIPYEVTNDGKQALELITKRAKENRFFDVVIMDCNMPTMNGFEASKRIKALVKNKQLRGLKIIACTANVENDERVKCFESGMDYFLPKPLNKGDFVDMINKIRAQGSFSGDSLEC